MSQHIQTIKVCVLGDGNVGKSALTIRYFQDQFVEDWDPTIEDLYTRKDILKVRGEKSKIILEEIHAYIVILTFLEPFSHQTNV